MKFLVLAALLASHILLSSACSCLPTTLKKAYHAPSTTRVVRATVVNIIEPCNPCGPADQLKKRFFLLRVVKVYKGCSVPRFIWISSRLSSAACGIFLQKGKDYIFPLPSGGVPMVSSCQFIRLWNSLSKADVKFLESRQICCKGKGCFCTNGKRPVNCFVRPCRFAKPPCREAVKCVDNYCGGCFAEWFTSRGMPACGRGGIFTASTTTPLTIAKA